MQKVEIADIMVRNTTLTRSQALEAIDAFTDAVKKALCNGENIYLRGFATLKVVTRAPKKARNIKRGTAVLVPARQTIKFLPGKDMKSCLDMGLTGLIPW